MKPLTDVQKRLLQKLYYKEGNFIGQKRLFALSKKATKDFLSKQYVESQAHCKSDWSKGPILTKFSPDFNFFQNPLFPNVSWCFGFR